MRKIDPDEYMITRWSGIMHDGHQRIQYTYRKPNFDGVFVILTCDILCGEHWIIDTNKTITVGRFLKLFLPTSRSPNDWMLYLSDEDKMMLMMKAN